MIIEPGGRQCYCGKRGCVNAYCSLHALLNRQEDIGEFFIRLRRGDSSYVERWDIYLDYLAAAIDNFHMVVNSNVILGGTLAHYLTEDDMERLHQRIAHQSAFPTSVKYISISNCFHLPACIGAALPFVREHLDSIM